MDPNNKHAKRANGRLVVKALEHLAVPSTLTAIVEWILCRTSADPVELIQSVRSTISHGLSLGFVDALQRKYYLTSHEFLSDCDDEVVVNPAKRPHPPEEVAEAEPPLKRRRLIVKENSPPERRTKKLTKKTNATRRN